MSKGKRLTNLEMILTVFALFQSAFSTKHLLTINKIIILTTFCDHIFGRLEATQVYADVSISIKAVIHNTIPPT